MHSSIYAKTVLVNDEGQVLLLRRSSSDVRRPGEWDFPGGKIEEGEDLLLGGAREIKEEIGAQIPSYTLKLVYAATEAYEDQSVTRLLLTAKFPKPEIKLSFEHDRYEWVDVATALEKFPLAFYAGGLKYAQDHGLLPG